MNIRLSTEVDDELLQEFKAKEWPRVDREHYGELLLDFSSHTCTLVAEDDRLIVGYGKLSAELGVARIESLIVGAEYRRQGIARELVRGLEEAAVHLGCHKICLETGAEWEAKALYEQLGYTVRAHLSNHYGGQDFLYYEKSL